MELVYFDNASTTQMRPDVITAMTDVMQSTYGNASSTHSFGREAKALIEHSRKAIAKHLNVTTSELFFTSGGTEADNLALRSAVRDLGVTTILTTKIEHHAVLHTLDQLVAEYGITVKYVKLEADGHIDYNDLEKLLTENDRVLVSLMHVNNEIGNILNINKVGVMCRDHDAFFHSDMVQSIGHYKIDLASFPIDFAAVSAHKFHGPKGVGFTYIKKGTKVQPLIFGGGQERGYRAGTESVHNIVGMTKALDLAFQNLEEEQAYIKDLKYYFINQLKTVLPEVTFNGDCLSETNSTYTVVNVCLPVEASKSALFLFQLDLKGIACSKGSACQSGAVGTSHVLAELLNEADLKKPSLRFSFSRFNTKSDIDYVVTSLKELINP